MRVGRLWLTGLVGVALLVGLIALISLDLVYPKAASPGNDGPAAAPLPVLDDPAPAPECCPVPDPEVSPSLQFLLLGEVPMELQAVDRNLTIPLTPDQVRRLRVALTTSTPVEIPSPSYMIQRYPRLQIVAQRPNGAATLVLNNLERLSESQGSGSPYSSWSMPPGLWEEVASWLPPETSKPGELAYLLRAEHLIEPYPSGPIVYDADRAALIARAMQAGTPIEQPTGEIQFTHTYMIEGTEYPVQVGVDWFTYAGRGYHMKDAALVLGATLHAN
ncbi:MAG TPA: hypothetical protein VK191_11910 [Symbiobacteriaceae bacterium]|nr:hypothetical protein [Symbiobacteriaceae bacterium]